MTRTVLCVDREDRVGSVRDVVEQNEDTVTRTASTIDEVETVLSDEAIACVVTAYKTGGGATGLDVAGHLRETAPQTPCIIYTDTDVDSIETTEFEELVVEFLDRTRDGAQQRLQFLVDDLINHSVQAQVGYLAPSDEQDRLDALEQYDLDELPIEQTFDRVSTLIADHFDAAVAFIGLVKRDEEEFIACEGSDLDPVTREDTMCTHAILEENVMTVEDIRGDKRFSENELLKQFGIRAYAGANLTTPNGHVIGTVCILYTEPREFDAETCNQLQSYADTVMELLELRRQVVDIDGPDSVREVLQ